MAPCFSEVPTVKSEVVKVSLGGSLDAIRFYW